jgi:hypothetical protein
MQNSDLEIEPMQILYFILHHENIVFIKVYVWYHNVFKYML